MKKNLAAIALSSFLFCITGTAALATLHPQLAAESEKKWIVLPIENSVAGLTFRALVTAADICQYSDSIQQEKCMEGWDSYVSVPELLPGEVEMPYSYDDGAIGRIRITQDAYCAITPVPDPPVTISCESAWNYFIQKARQ